MLIWSFKKSRREQRLSYRLPLISFRVARSIRASIAGRSTLLCKSCICLAMAVSMESRARTSMAKKDGRQEETEHRIRITLTSRFTKDVEEVTAALIKRAKDKGLDVKGPVRLPTK